MQDAYDYKYQLDCGQKNIREIALVPTRQQGGVPEIRERIESLREQQAQVSTPKQIKREMDENNKDAIIVSLKRKIKKLDEENKELREQLKFAYAEVYKKI